MSYKVYWLFKETDEPFGSGFIYSRGEVGVRTGFPAAISQPCQRCLHCIFFLGYEKMLKVLSLKKGVGGTDNSLSSVPLINLSLHSSVEEEPKKAERRTNEGAEFSVDFFA